MVRIGLRFGLGPLFVYIPLVNGLRRKARGRRASSAGRAAGQAAGRATAAALTGLVKLCWWGLVAAFFLLAWPYLVARWLGDRRGWSKQRAIGVGVVATLGWLLLALVVDTGSG